MREPFFLVIKDEDAQVFAVKGPMTDDTPWMDRVTVAQDTGRSVRCFAVENMPRSEVVRQMKEQFGYEEVPSVSLSQPK
jgi:hypothetical protein